MNNKYCELPASKSISEFKVGNRVRVFQREETDGYVTDITDNFLFINPDGEFDKTVTILVHFKACRKLKAFEPREYWIYEDNKTGELSASKNPIASGFLVLEVLDD